MITAAGGGEREGATESTDGFKKRPSSPPFYFGFLLPRNKHSGDDTVQEAASLTIRSPLLDKDEDDGWIPNHVSEFIMSTVS